MINGSAQDEIIKADREDSAPEPIAIIGIGCRFPGAKNPAAFWNLLRDGVDAITELPADRWDMDAYFNEDPKTPGTISSRWCGTLGRVDEFDAPFFKISPREAVQIDPQQRLLMEVAWESLEDAGQVPEKLAGSKTGVFIGVMAHDYSYTTMSDASLVDFYTVPGFASSINANRLSYFFDFRGPSMAVDTACSSSLVAIHLACRSIWNGESTMALAGGVNIILSPEGAVWYTQGGLLASDGRCKAFDSRADGLGRGEGAGVVVLKPLSQAVADGDSIYAVIKGSAVNQDGRSNGLTAPNRFAQEAVMREAYKLAGVSPGRIQYVEAHGTGTALGDPIEANALGTVLATERAEGDRCAIGSVKTNIGHLEAAAGVAALIKVALMLKHRSLAPSLHYENPNPHIPFETLPLRVQRTLEPWGGDAENALAGINACGFGGTNAHVVVGNAPSAAGATPSQELKSTGRAQLLTLSGRTPEALSATAQAFQEYLASADASVSFDDICYTATMRRTQHEHRLSVVAGSREEASARLEAFTRGEQLPAISVGRKPAGRAPKIVFVYPGQGSQWLGMGRQLLRQETVFRASIERCDEAIKNQAGWSLLEQLEAGESESRLSEIDIVQPTLFALQVALTALWRSWGIEPAAVVGQSMGEVAAAHVAGALSLEDAVRIICERSRLLKRLSGQGAMAALELSLEQAQAALKGYEGRLSVAVSNSPSSTVIAGEPSALEELVQTLQARQIFCRYIKADVASHCPQVDPLREDLLEVLEGIQPLRATTPIYSTATGEFNPELVFDASYWWKNLREPVLFSPAIEYLLETGCETFVEIGPHPIVLSSIQQVLYHTGRQGRVLPSLRREEDEATVILGSLGQLHAVGVKVNLQELFTAKGNIVSLPNYAWQRERFWLERKRGEASFRQSTRPGVKGRRPLLGSHLQSAHPSISHLWELKLEKQSFQFLDDHCIQKTPVLPATAYVEMVLEAAEQAYGLKAELAGVEFRRALFLNGPQAPTLQLAFSHGAEGKLDFHIYSRVEEDGREALWTLHATGKLQPLKAEATVAFEQASLDEIGARCSEKQSGESFYEFMRQAGNVYGPAFQGIEKVRRRDGEVLARLRVPTASKTAQGNFLFHPALLDNCLQALGAALSASAAERGPCVPVGIEQVRVGDQSGTPVWIHATLRSDATGASEIKGDVSLLDEEGEVLIEFSGVRLQFLEESAQPSSPVELQDWLYELQWHEQPRAQAAIAPNAKTVTTNAGRNWLIFADGDGVGASLAQLIEARGEGCTLVSAGDEFEQLDERRFRLNPSKREDVERLFQIFTAGTGGAPRSIVHLWNLNNATQDRLGVESLGDAQTMGCLSAVHVLQSLAEATGNGASRLWLVTRGAQSLAADARIELAQTPVWGLGRTLAQEQPALWGGLIDLENETSAEQAATQLSDEIFAADEEKQVALREGRRYVARLVRRSQDTDALALPFQWRPDGSYLVTGGFGGLGLLAASWMVEQGARRLILMGRTELPPRGEWGQVEAASKPGKIIAAIRRLEAQGASIHVASVDVADEAQLTTFLEAFGQEGWPEIRGVVHCAGVLRDKTLLQLDAEALNVPWQSKVNGAWLLHHLLADKPLDFFVLFSSAASLLGSAGQANYAAANSFLDALAQQRRHEGRAGLSINWGAWSEVGQAAVAARGGRLAERGFGSIAPEQGLEVLARLLRQDAAQVGVLPLDWSLIREFTPELAANPFFSALSSEADGAPATQTENPAEQTGMTRELLRAAGAEDRRELLEVYLYELASRVLRIAPSTFEPERPLNTLGLDSLMAIELKNSVQSKVGVLLPLVSIMQGATTTQLVGQVLELFAEQEASASSLDSTDLTPAGASIGDLNLDELDEPGAADLLAGIEELTAEQIDQLLADMLIVDEVAK